MLNVYHTILTSL